MNNFNEIPFFIRLALKLLMLSLIACIIFLGQNIIVPFAFALLLAILLLPVNVFLERKGIPRAIAIIISLIISIIVISGIIYFLATQIVRFMSDIPAIQNRLNEHLQTLQEWINRNLPFTTKEQTQIINNATDKIKDSGTGFIGQTFLSVTQTITYILLIPVYSFLLLYYRDMIRKFLADIFNKEHEEKVADILKESRIIVQSYMLGLIIEMSIVASLNAIGFVVIGVQYAILLGLMAAILNMIPYIGGLIATIICMIITLTSSQYITDIIWVAIVLMIVQFIDNNILMPKIVSSKVKINALISILGVITGGALAGISGMFLSIPGIAILKVIFDRVEELKPWGMLLGDEITGTRKSEIYKRLEKMRHRKKINKLP